jgi:hypothetical protein
MNSGVHGLIKETGVHEFKNSRIQKRQFSVFFPIKKRAQKPFIDAEDFGHEFFFLKR